MTEIEIAAALNKLKNTPSYTTHKGKDTEFYVTKFSIAGGMVFITTTIDKHCVPVKNLSEFLAIWSSKPLQDTAAVVKTAAEPKSVTQETTQLSGAAAKHPHITSDIKVYVTRDYAIFKKTTGNRMLNKSKIRKIVYDIEHGLNRLADYPMSVDQEMHVLDGQHRLEAAIQTKENIYYIIARPMEMHQVARVNSNTERWKSGDFINCYISQGSNDYKVLDAFMRKYGFPFSVCLNLLSGWKVTGGKSELKDKFERGLFQTSETRVIAATQLADLVSQFSDFSGYKGGQFISAIQAIKDKKLVDWDILLQKFKKKPDALKPNCNKKQYIQDLELIYNLGAHKRTVIY